MKSYIDCHCHLLDDRLDATRNEMILKSQAKGITHFVLGGYGPQDWQKQIQNKAPHFINSFGLHPYWVNDHKQEECEAAINQLSQMIGQCQILGEVGLDAREKYEASLDRQKEFMTLQLELAQVAQKPVCFHIVRAHQDTLKIYDFFGHGVRGYVHAFNSSKEIMLEYLKRDLYISIGGGLLRPQAHKLEQALIELPLDRLLIESDTPDQPPYGEITSSPVTILKVAQKIAEIKKISIETILSQSKANIENLLK